LLKNYCPVCQGNNFSSLCSYRGDHEFFSDLILSKCHTCGMVFTTPMPKENDLLAYNATYFASAHGGKPNNPVGLAFFSAVARLRVAHIERYLIERQVTVSRVLEFGPGPGFFAASWLEKHPESEYLVVETDTSCYCDLEKLGVQVVNAETLSYDFESVDLVVMSHVLEHVADPRVFIDDATKILRRRGVLFVEVPCLDFKHKSIDEPHLLFFDKAPMQFLLNSMGCDDIQLSYFGQEIDALRSRSALYKAWMRLRSGLIRRGLFTPFAFKRSGMEELTSPMERAVVAPYMAHCESLSPAWWLRALAQKI
jgi:SAM-dependent methyltransferase